MRGIQSNTMILCAPGNRGASLLSRRAHLLTTPKGRWYCLRQLCALRGGCGFCGSLMDNVTSRRCCCHCPRRRLYILLHQQNSCFHFGNNLPSASEKHQPDVFHCYGYRFFCDTHFLFAKKKQKQGYAVLAYPERTVKTNGDIPLGSKGGQPWHRAIRCGGCRISELYQYS